MWVFPECNYSVVSIRNKNSTVEGRQQNKKKERQSKIRKPINQHGLLVGKSHNRYRRELLSKYAVFSLSQVLRATMTKYEIAVYDVTTKGTHNYMPIDETERTLTQRILFSVNRYGFTIFSD